MIARSLTLFIMVLSLVSCSMAEKGSQVTFQVNRDQDLVEVMIGGEPFTAYRFESTLEKPVLYPIHSPGGTVVTRGFPIEPREMERVDHPHHVGLWFNFGDVNGFDFWNNSFAIPAERKVHYGRINHRDIVRAESEGDKGILEVNMDWVAPDNNQSEKLLMEHTLYIFQGNEKIRTIDRITSLTAVADQVVFTDNKEGMLAIRVDRAFELPSDQPEIYTDASGNPTEVPLLNNEGVTGWYRNSNGIEGNDAWGKRAKWVKLSSTKAGANCSMVLMDHPGNIGYPSCWHARGYGLFSVNNMGSQVFNAENDPFKLILSKGESVTFRHRFVVASGNLTDEEINDLYSQFIKE